MWGDTASGMRLSSLDSKLDLQGVLVKTKPPILNLIPTFAYSIFLHSPIGGARRKMNDIKVKLEKYTFRSMAITGV